ncbi:MAG: LysE family translocator [Thermoplasmata archaeon]
MITETYAPIIGYLLGLSLSAPPGPVNAVIMNESSKSPLHGTSVGAGAMTADLIFLVILYTVKDAVPHWVFEYLYVIGAVYMLYLAASVLRSRMPSKSRKGNYIVGLSMGISNPFQILWWATVGFFLIERLTLLSVIFFFLGIVTWIVAFPLAMNRVGKVYGNAVKIFSFLVLVSFSALMIFYALEPFLLTHQI